MGPRRKESQRRISKSWQRYGTVTWDGCTFNAPKKNGTISIDAAVTSRFLYPPVIWYTRISIIDYYRGRGGRREIWCTSEAIYWFPGLDRLQNMDSFFCRFISRMFVHYIVVMIRILLYYMSGPHICFIAMTIYEDLLMNNSPMSISWGDHIYHVTISGMILITANLYCVHYRRYSW